MGKNVVIAVLGMLVVALGVMLFLQQPRETTNPQPGTSPQPTQTASSQQEPLPGSSTSPEAAPPASATAEPPVDPAYEEFLLGLARRDPEDFQAKGEVDAPLVMVEWSDFRCGYCNRFATQTLAGLQPYVEEGTLRIEFRNMAILGDASVSAAAAAHAAGLQGKFWEFHDALFATLSDGSREVQDDLLVEVAGQVGVPDPEQFRTDMASDTTRQAVMDETTAASQLGISATPTFVLGTEVIQGAQPLEHFESVIAEQLENLGTR